MISTDRKPTRPIPPSAAAKPEAVPLPESLVELPADKLTNALQSHLLASIQLMQRLIQRRSDSERGKWERLLDGLQAALRMVHSDYPSEAFPSETMPGDGALDPERVRDFGRLVTDCRKAAGMNRHGRSSLWAAHHRFPIEWLGLHQMYFSAGGLLSEHCSSLESVTLPLRR